MTPLLTVEQLADLLQMSPDWVYEQCAAKRIPHHRIGQGRGRIRFAPEDLDAIKTATRVVPDPRRLRSTA